MTTEPFVAFSNHVISASNLSLVAGQVQNVASSPIISNSSGTIYNSIQIRIKYSALLPAQVTSYRIGAVLESLTHGGEWTAIHYQFSPLHGFAEAMERVLIMQPNMDTYNLGIDDVVYPVDRETARISRAQGFLPETSLRLCIQLVDHAPAGTNPFNTVTVSASGELYNV